MGLTDRLRGAFRAFRMYGVLFAANFRAEGQYRANLITAVIGAIAHQGAGFAFIWVVIAKFEVIGGWTLPELAFLYGMRLTAHGIFTFFGAQLLSDFDVFVREGLFDRYLVRPLSPFVQVLTRRLNMLVLGDLLGGLALLVTAATMVDVTWSALTIGYLVLALIGGAMVEGAMHIVISSFSFRVLSTQSLRYGVDNLLTTYGGYPLKIFPGVARFGFTFLLPLAFLAYFPATVLLGRAGELSVDPWLARLAPVVGLVLLVAAYHFWRYQSRYYTSSGH